MEYYFVICPGAAMSINIYTLSLFLKKYCGKIIWKCKKHVEKRQFVAWHVLLRHFLNYTGCAEKVINYSK